MKSIANLELYVPLYTRNIMNEVTRISENMRYVDITMRTIQTKNLTRQIFIPIYSISSWYISTGETCD